MKVFLHNPTRANIVITLNKPIQQTSMRLRRADLMTPITIPAGQKVDLCKFLGLSASAAERVLEESPEARVAAKRFGLAVLFDPPKLEQLARMALTSAQETHAKLSTEAMRPVDPPNAVPAGVDLEAAGLPLDTPLMFNTPTADKPFRMDDVNDRIEEGVEIPSTTGVEDAVQPDETEPSTAWTKDKLVEYARSRGLDTGGSKLQILRRIRGV